MIFTIVQKEKNKTQHQSLKKNSSSLAKVHYFFYFVLVEPLQQCGLFLKIVHLLKKENIQNKKSKNEIKVRLDLPNISNWHTLKPKRFTSD